MARYFGVGLPETAGREFLSAAEEAELGLGRQAQFWQRKSRGIFGTVSASGKLRDRWRKRKWPRRIRKRICKLLDYEHFKSNPHLHQVRG